MPLIGSEAIPIHGFVVRLLHAFTLSISDAEIVLGLRIALTRREGEPFYPLGLVLRHPTSRGVHDGEIVLRLGLAALGSESELRYGLGEVLRHAFAVDASHRFLRHI